MSQIVVMISLFMGRKVLFERSVYVCVMKELDFYINENQVIESNLENELKVILANQEEPAIILHADKTVDIEHVVKVMDIAYRNKYKIVLATKPN